MYSRFFQTSALYLYGIALCSSALPLCFVVVRAKPLTWFLMAASRERSTLANPDKPKLDRMCHRQTG